MKCCPACGQTLPEPLPMGVKLSAGQKRIVELVRLAGKNGIPAEKLFERVYEDDPDGGPLTGVKCLHVRVMLLNRQLKKVGKVIRAPFGRGSSGYVLQDIRCP